MALYLVRAARSGDLEEIVRVEKECFPSSEAATKQQLKARLQNFGNHFYVLEYAGTVIGLIDGMVTDCETISDDMYRDEALHTETGKWQTVFGLDVSRYFRRKGFAGLLMQKMIQAAREEKRLGVILTCKEGLIPFYEKFGFCKMGISKSVHGGAVWYDMMLRFAQQN